MKQRKQFKQTATDHNPDSCQVEHKTQTTRARSGMATVAYWRHRLYQNTYRDRQGVKVTIPEYYARMRHGGTTKQVRLDYADKEKAAEQALQKYLRLEQEGWQVITSRLARLPASPTIEEFCDIYRKSTASMVRIPRNISVTTYCRSLKQIAALAGAKKIRELNSEAIERAQDKYRERARAEGRNESGTRNTLAKILRNAAACFSTNAIAVMRRKGFAIENPFEGISKRQDIKPATSLPLPVIERLYREANLLRDGDPNAPAVNVRLREGGRAPIDFRKPHPAAYAAFLLAIGAGLRANEIDKARWSWLKLSESGDCFLEISEETDFKPKGGSSRTIKIQQSVYDALIQLRTDKASPYILGGTENEESDSGEIYRATRTLRVVNRWLRDRNVVKGQNRGNPLHRLRKQFACEVATSFGLFHAQKLMGHSSPTLTSKYYSALTNLPALTHVKLVG